MKIALYARVSTREQNPEVQMHALRKYADARGADPMEYIDHGVSGARDRRPALDRLVVAARRREIDAVAVVKLDRLARSVAHLTSFVAELEALGVDLIVLDQGMDTTTPAGKLIFHVLGAMAEFERDLIRERTTAGVAAARRAGKRLGRPRALEGEKLARARRLASSGHSQRYIAKLLGVGRATLSRAGIGVAQKVT